MEVIIKKITVGNWQVNCYLIAIENEAWIVDPGDEFDNIVTSLNLDNFNLKGIINTHGHFDHIGAVAEIKDHFKIPFFIHSKDKRLVNQANLYKRMVGDSNLVKTPAIDGYLDELIPFDLNKCKIKIHYIPGHSTGSVCFEIEKNLFSGDIIFEDNIGRTDLPGGNKESLLNSINYIFDNFLGYQIFPGHGASFVLDESVVQKLKSKI